MNWKIKSGLFRVLENAPFGDCLYYLLQRYVTRSLPRSSKSVLEVLKVEKWHINMFNKYGQSERPYLCYEFGAGWDLCGAISRYYLGINNQVVIDISRLASPWQINYMLNDLFKIESLSAKGLVLPKLDSIEDNLLSYFGIQYLAPQDARNSTISENSVDLIVSNNTLEHIPFSEIKLIFAECKRISKLGAVISMEIDYGDHYSYSDSSINLYNFLSFSEKEWIKYNSRTHYQNRARHCDYKALFEICGFTLLFEETEISGSARDQLSTIEIHEEFSRYSFEDLLPTRGRFVLTL
jgi:Methyltransferase domain